jgi:hypothetical protein
MIIPNMRPTLSGMERLAIFVGVALMFMLAFTTVAPYCFVIRSPELVRQIDQTQNTIQNLALILFGFLFGASVGNRTKDQTIDTLAKTAQVAGAALGGGSADSINLPPGTQASVKSTDDGTEIKPQA